MKASLSRNGAALNERDFFKDPFTADELRNLLGDTPPADVFSWRSPSARKLSLDKDAVTDDELLRLMEQEPRLVRRPLTRIGGRLIIGGNKAAMSAIADALGG